MALARIVRENEILRLQNEELQQELNKNKFAAPIIVLGTIAVVIILPVVLGLN